MRTRVARRLRFRTWHLLVFIALVAVFISSVNVAARAIGYRSTTVEIIQYHPTWAPNGSVEFLVDLPGGFSQSAVAVGRNDSSIDYSELVGTKYELRYRPRRILWFAPQNPEIEAFKLVEGEVQRLAVLEGNGSL